MQIESLLQLGAVPAETGAQFGAPAVSPDLAPEFAGLLEQALTTPPDVPDPGPPGPPINLTIEEAHIELPNATETQPLDLPIEPRNAAHTDCRPQTDGDDEVEPALTAEVLAYAVPPQFVPSAAIVATDEPEAKVETVGAVAPDEEPVFAPSREFAEYDLAPKADAKVEVTTPEQDLQVAPGTVKQSADTQLLTSEQLDFLNPTKVEQSAEVPRHPLTGEPLNPAKITFTTDEIAPKQPAEAKVTTPTEPVVAAQPKPKSKFAFADRVDMKRAFESGFSETIERVEVPAQPVTETVTKAAKPTPEPVVEPQAPANAPKEEVFQLKGSETTPIKDGLLTLETKETSKDSKPVDEPKADLTTREGVAPTRTEASQPKEKPQAPIDDAKLHRQIVDRAETFLAFRREGALTIHLEPRELGQITMSVKLDNGQVRTEIQATNQQVAQSLESNKQQLVQQVESRGLSLGSLNVSTGGHSGNQQGQHQTATHQDFARQQQLARHFAPPSHALAPVARAYTSPTSMGLDYLI
ncbi:MAG: flagellar hook-length control protein FliK [Chthonomonas sp.]|nr:flagellar hook-length control protein FliK [Chthonomonas sp.]